MRHSGLDYEDYEEVYYNNHQRIWSAVRHFCDKQGLFMGNVEMEIDSVEGLYFIHVDETGIKTFYITIEDEQITISSI